MFTLPIGAPDAVGDPKPQGKITLRAEPDVFRTAFMTLTAMYLKRYGMLKEEQPYPDLGQPYPDLLMLPIYHIADVVLMPDEFRIIQEQARTFRAQEHPKDNGVRDVLKALIDAKLPVGLAGREDADARGGGKRATILTISPWAVRGWNDDTKSFTYTYVMYCPRCDLVKVGGSSDDSDDLEERRRAVQRDHRKKKWCPGTEIAVLATFPGNKQAWFRRREFPGLYARCEWLPYVPGVERFLSRAFEAGLAAKGPKDLPDVPNWTPERERQVFTRRRRSERILLARVLLAAWKGNPALDLLYQQFAAHLPPWPRLDAIP
jgi:hypothetical protein